MIIKLLLDRNSDGNSEVLIIEQTLEFVSFSPFFTDVFHTSASTCL